MEKLLPVFEKANPGIKVKFTTLDENTLRAKLTQQVATKGGAYDAVMGGPNDIAAWASNKWLVGLNKFVSATPSYDVNDILTPVRNGLSVSGQLYGVPFTGESSFLYYRKDLFAKAGLTMPAHPTWDQVQKLAAQLNDPSAGVSGICMRGEAGWGSNMPTIVNMIHAYGGHLYSPSWKPGLDSAAARKGIQQYLDMIHDSGEKGAANSSFQECSNIWTEGKAAMWYDATSAAGDTFSQSENPYAKDTAVTATPAGSLNSGGWLYTWAFAMLKTTKNQAATWKFLSWITSKQYIALAGKTYGWNLVPPGTRSSTYAAAKFQTAASAYAAVSLKTLNNAGVKFTGANALERSYYVAIPQWDATGDKLGQIFAGAVAGTTTTDQAITQADQLLATTAQQGGYTK